MGKGKENTSGPTGNAIIYWYIRGNNKLFKHAEIIASNFVISPLQVKDETLMVNFPPVLVENYDKLVNIAEKNDIDLIKGEDIVIPDDIDDFSEFFKSQIEKYNGLIQEYLLAYKEKNAAGGEGGGGEFPSVPRLIGHATETMEKIRTMVKYKESSRLIADNIRKLRDIQKQLRSEMSGLTFDGVLRFIRKPSQDVDSLVALYREKLLALFLEDYERAAHLKRDIVEIEEKLKG
jgi:hypothetical protein